MNAGGDECIDIIKGDGGGSEYEYKTRGCSSSPLLSGSESLILLDVQVLRTGQCGRRGP